MLRSDYSLPDFVRVSWVSDGAKDVWDPIFKSIRNMWARVELESVRQGQRALAIVGVPSDRLESYREQRQADGLLALPLYRYCSAAYISDLNASNRGADMLACAVGKPSDAHAGTDAFKANHTSSLGELLGYPDCCRKFFDAVWNVERYIDTTWPMADRSTCVKKPTPCTCVADSNPSTNILLRWLGLRPVFHLPCSLDCRNTAAVALSLRDVATACGESNNWSYLEEVLAWPVQWSALHGIAEIETPIVRVATRTDATPSKYVVRLNGSGNAIQAAPYGTRFPFAKKPSRQMIQINASETGAKPAQLRPAQSAAQFYLGFGFNSYGELREACNPIIDAIMRTGATSVFHLACKNGALMFEACRSVPGLRVGGLDVNVERIAAARKYLPNDAERFTQGTFEEAATAPGSQSECWVLMVGRLLELPREQANNLLNVCRSKARSLVLYAFSDWLQDSEFEALINHAGMDMAGSRITGRGVAVIQFS